jgi:hypothetical protein
MSKKEIIEKVKEYTELLKKKLPIRMVILEKAFPGEEFKKDFQIEVSVVVNELVRDYLEVKEDLFQLAKQVDPRIEPVLIENDKDDPTGFCEEVYKSGEIIYSQDMGDI